MSALWLKALPYLLAVIGAAFLVFGFYNWAKQRGAEPWRNKYHEYVATVVAQDQIARQRAEERERVHREAENAWLKRQADDQQRVDQARRDLAATDDERDRRLRDAVAQLNSCRVRGLQVPRPAAQAEAPPSVQARSPERLAGEIDQAGGITVFRRRIEQLNLDYEACRSYVESLP